MRKLNTKTITAIVANCLLYLVFLSGCNLSPDYLVITRKIRFGAVSSDASCYCSFEIAENHFDINDRTFTDSCHKYNVGDTIVGRKKN